MCVGECGCLIHFTDRHEHMKSQHVPGCVLIYSDSDLKDREHNWAKQTLSYSA